MMAAEERLIKTSTLLKAIEPDKVTWRFGVPNTLNSMVDFLRLIINEQPAVDAVEVVRCKNCEYYMTIHCTCDGCCISDSWYCADGERSLDDH